MGMPGRPAAATDVHDVSVGQMTDDRKAVEHMMTHEFGFVPDCGEVVYPIPFHQQVQIARELIHCRCRQCQSHSGDPLPEQRYDLIQCLFPALRDRLNLFVDRESAKSAFQMHQQEGNRSRGNARNPRRLTKRFRSLLVEFLLHFDRQAANRAIIEIPRQARRFELFLPAHLIALALDVTLIFDLNLDLLGSVAV